MKLTAEEVFQKLLNEEKILEIQGQIRFYLGNVDIVVKQKDVVGNMMQEWLEGWLRKNHIDFKTNPNSQMPPDFFLNPENLTVDLLEVKAFNFDAQPGFDIADFNMYQSEIVEKPYMLHVKYLIFGYQMTDDGYVIIKKLWLKNVWEICRRMENWPINLQIKDSVVHKIRPCVWYSEGNVKYLPFNSLESFISAMEETVFRNPKTRLQSGTWLQNFKKNYFTFYNIKLDIPRWNDIEDSFIGRQ